MSDIKILLVDDEMRLRKLVRDYLVKQDYLVIEAADGEEAYEKFYRNTNLSPSQQIQHMIHALDTAICIVKQYHIAEYCQCTLEHIISTSPGE